ncbi:hypothetical protein GCM10011329_37070 [Stakelama pacifica]|nr:hypothetical protein GCM10011329_37070 [Stakelama pacifica]
MSNDSRKPLAQLSSVSNFDSLDSIFSDPTIEIPEPTPICARCPAAWWGQNDGDLNVWCRMMHFWAVRPGAGVREVCRARDFAIHEVQNQKKQD